MIHSQAPVVRVGFEWRSHAIIQRFSNTAAHGAIETSFD